MARGVRCLAHKHDSPVAEERHHLQPQSRGGPTVAANMRYLCANAHGDTHYLLDLIEDEAVKLIGPGGPHDKLKPYEMIPWDVRRTYGPGVRNAALTGWLKYADRFLAGAFRAHHLLWSTSGSPRLGRFPADGAGLAFSFAAAVLADQVDMQLAAARRAIERGHAA